ncbi:MAG: phospholipase D family protein [Thiobacillus sp.]|nr:phospholipase D family protein [Thiobacillus sp.]
MHMIRRFFLVLLLCGGAWQGTAASPMAFIDTQIAAHPGATGAYVLDTGEEALRARAWLADHAQHTIEVQYFIWSSDNIGILATEALLRAAERGVKVRVIVDDLLIDASDKTLLALAKHPGVDIRIYNPKHRVGTPFYKRALNVVTDFRGVNQRMHDKTFIVDGKVAITGGRNMADEYFDYDHEYTFRDRDALLVGEAAQAMRVNFDAFWASKLAVPVESLYDGWGLMQKNVKVGADEVQQVYRALHAYADRPENLAPEVRAAIAATPAAFDRLARDMAWGRVDFIHDEPGKNGRRWTLGGGGKSSAALAQLVAGARESIVIQSPYLVMSDKAKALFKAAVARGVKVRILTNSLASTDNLQAFSGYRSQRSQLLKMGLDIREYKPDPANRNTLFSRANPPAVPPVFALHAKSMVVDGQIAYIGTFNFDPRSENLNTEVGAIIHHPGLAQRLQAIMEADMRPENSWSAADKPDQYVPLTMRGHVRLWQLLPLKPLL